MGDGRAGRDSLLSRALASEWIPPGLFFIALGAAALWMSRDYPLGDLNRMGPGYFPRMLSVGMIGLGVLIVRSGPARARRRKGPACRARPQLLAHSDRDGRVRTFGRALGLVVALALTLAIAGAAHREARIKEVAISIVTLIALLVLIFVVVLKLPLRLWPEF